MICRLAGQAVRPSLRRLNMGCQNNIVTQVSFARGISRQLSNVRELADDWSAVYSPEHGRDFFWHRPSGKTVWELPAGASAFADASEVSTFSSREPIPAKTSACIDVLDSVTPQWSTGSLNSSAGDKGKSGSSITQEATSSKAVGISAAQARSRGAGHVAADVTVETAAKNVTQVLGSQRSPMRAREIPVGWVAVQSAEHGREYFWHRQSGKTVWELPEPASALADGSEVDVSTASVEPIQATTSEKTNVSDAVAQDVSAGTVISDAGVGDTGKSVSSATQEGVSSTATDISLAQVRSACVGDAAANVAAEPEAQNMTQVFRSKHPPMRGGEILDGWVAVQSAEHGREYFWHRQSGKTVWELPELASALADGSEFDASTASSVGQIPAMTSAKTDVPHVVPPHESIGTVSSRAGDIRESVSSATQEATSSTATDISLARERSAADVAEETAAQNVTQVFGRQRPPMRARDFPDGWVAVQSAEHGREYFWHRPSGVVTWDPPAPTADPTFVASADAVAVPTAGAGFVGSSVLATFGDDHRALRSKVSDILRDLGPRNEQLGPEEFSLVRELLEYHPECAAKTGVGIVGIKAGPSLHASSSYCFWVLRGDGTTEDFSVRKCLAGFRQAGASVSARV